MNATDTPSAPRSIPATTVIADDHYARFVKRRFSDILGAIGLDVTYVRASGCTMTYREADGREVEVLDLVAGYGALILGHHHPKIIAAGRAVLDQQRPIHHQFSLKKEVGDLAARLSSIVRRDTGLDEDLVTVFSSTGAEAIEVALKHAEFQRQRRVDTVMRGARLALEAAAEAIRRGHAHLAAMPNGLSVSTWAEPEEVFALVAAHNHLAEETSPLFLAVERSFHGKLMTSVQVTAGKAFRRPFARLGVRTRFISLTEPDHLDRIVAEHAVHLYTARIAGDQVWIEPRVLPVVAAVLAEPIQGEGGIHPLPEAFLRRLRTFCNEHECPLVFDEIQCGMGRTGRFLASSHTGVRADIYTLSKALGGGIAKIAATMVRASHFDQEFGLVHSSTFAEDGFSTAVAQAVLDQLEADDGAFYAQVRARGQSLLAGLEGLRQCYGTVIADVRGQGLMLAVEFHDQAQASSIIFRSAAHTDAFGYFVAGYLLREHGIRVAPTGSSPNTIRIQPPALIDDRQIAQVLAGFQQLCQIISRQDTYHLAHAMAAAGPGPARKVRHHVQDFRHQFSEQPPAAIGRASRRVAFINHLITPEWLGVADPSMADLTPEEQRRFVLKLEANKVVAPFPPVRVVSATGSSIDFMIYPLCVCSEQMAGWLASGNLEGIREDVQKRIEVARADGCEIAGLGMYTSIVTNNCLSVSVPGMGLTSGNALTVAMGLEAIERAVAQTGRDPQTMTVALVGAAGNIAATYASLLAPWAGRVLLFGSTREGSRMRLERTRQGLYADLWHDIQVGQHHPKNPLARAVSAVCGADHAVTGGPAIAEAIGRYYGGQDPHCHIADDLAMVAEADVVVCMANADRPFLDARHFRPGAIVCDLAVPNNVVAGLAEARPDLQLFAGGIVATPHGESLHPAARAGLSQGQVYACMAETMVLGLAGRSGHFSYGSLGRSQVREIAGLAAQHGFRLAGFKHDRSL